MEETLETWLELPNGGRIEKNYLVKSIMIARDESNYRKVKFTEVYPNGESHAHCEICSQVISDTVNVSSIDTAYYSNETWVCPQCFSLFVDTNEFQSAILQLRVVNKPD